MVYTCTNLTATELARYGAVLQVVPRDELRDAAMRVARDIATRHPFVIRRAKESLNGIDPVDVHKSYRFEQGFTYELHVAGVAEEHRAAFVEKRSAEHVPTGPTGSMSNDHG